MIAAGSIVDAQGLCKDYGPRRVVTEVSFTLSRGECLGLLGPNGAGKTTTIRMVTCFTSPSAGRLTVLDLPTTPANHAAIKAGGSASCSRRRASIPISASSRT